MSNPRNVWFTADLHLDHTNIIKYCNRPFADAVEMNETILKRFNSVVGQNETVYILGDVVPFCRNSTRIKDLLRQFHGRKIILLGNHDVASVYTDKPDGIFTGCLRACLAPAVYEISINGNSIVMCHYKMDVWNRSHFGSFHLYGHSHGTRAPLGISSTEAGHPEIVPVRAMDVGVDTNDFYPYSLDEVVARLSQIPTPKTQNTVTEADVWRCYF